MLVEWGVGGDADGMTKRWRRWGWGGVRYTLYGYSGRFEIRSYVTGRGKGDWEGDEVRFEMCIRIYVATSAVSTHQCIYTVDL